jgi:hypothetical protein
MKKVLLGFLIFASSLALIHLFSQEFTYVGTEKCKTCHTAEDKGNQYSLWQMRGHSKAFEVLSSKEAFKAAADRGINGPPAESPECLKCHAPLFEKSQQLMQEGVTCEVCHGPGSAYSNQYRMKRREEAWKNGLTKYNSCETIKNKCMECHGNEGFDFVTAWEKIKHSLPGKN